MKGRQYIGLYGNVSIPKGWCEECQMLAFILRGKLACCDTPIEVDADRYKRESEPEQRRKLPPLWKRQRQLREQHYRCFYCNRMFGSTVCRGRKGIKLRPEFDHMIPYALTQDNSAENFVAACHVCNRMKSHFCFKTVEEAQIYLADKWHEKGYI